MTVFWRGLNAAGLIDSKQEKIEKVTSSRDDKKERIVVKIGRLLKEWKVANGLGVC
jgi:hypothetical protein